MFIHLAIQLWQKSMNSKLSTIFKYMNIKICCSCCRMCVNKNCVLPVKKIQFNVYTSFIVFLCTNYVQKCRSSEHTKYKTYFKIFFSSKVLCHNYYPAVKFKILHLFVAMFPWSNFSFCLIMFSMQRQKKDSCLINLIIDYERKCGMINSCLKFSFIMLFGLLKINC
jgi:hypothetical protein